MRPGVLVALLVIGVTACASIDRVETLERRLAVDQVLARRALDQAVHHIPPEGSWAIGPADAAGNQGHFWDYRFNVYRDFALGRSIGVTGTPAYYVNGLKTNNPTAAVEALLAGKAVLPQSEAADLGCTVR